MGLVASLSRHSPLPRERSLVPVCPGCRSRWPEYRGLLEVYQGVPGCRVMAPSHGQLAGHEEEWWGVEWALCRALHPAYGHLAGIRW